MNKNYYDDQTFEKIDSLSGREFNGCRFLNCNLTESDFANQDFIECVFENCDLSNVQLSNVGLKDVLFVNCKLMGIDFSLCSDFLFQVSFRDCLLNYITFEKQNLKGTLFANCSIREATFINSNMSSSTFEKCDLSGTVFDNINLSSANLSTAVNYTINPAENNLKKAKFSYPAVLSLLDGFNIEII